MKAKIGNDGLAYLKPQIAVSVAGVGRNFVNLDAIVDTGFTGWLALSEKAIEELD